MICHYLHDDYNNPPDIPAFSGNGNKKNHKESVSEVVAGAAMALTRALQGNSTSGVAGHIAASGRNDVPSPSKTVDVRLKNLEQLKILQQLHDDNVLTSQNIWSRRK